MNHERFSQSDAWELENPEDDLRGRTVVDGQGRTIGRVEDMLVDTASQSIDAVLLDNGREIPATLLDISGSDLQVLGDGGAGAAGQWSSGDDELDTNDGGESDQNGGGYR